MAKTQTQKLDQSRLCKLGSKARLVTVLNLPSLKALETLIENGTENYRVYIEKFDGRKIELPLGAMANCHKRLAKLLSRIKLPSYVHSQKGRSYVSNAREHANALPIAKTDITQYFPSTSFAHVHRLFIDDLKCPKDVAWYLTKLCTFDGHIPIGSPISNRLAYLANRPLFDRIHEYAYEQGCTMTLLQDDIVISGNAASKRVLNEILMMIRRWGLKASPKRRKTKTYPASAVKIVTGVAIKGDLVTLPNRRRKLLAVAFAAAKNAKTESDRSEAIKKLRGRISEADQIDPSAVHPRFRSLV